MNNIYQLPDHIKCKDYWFKTMSYIIYETGDMCMNDVR